MTTRPVPAHSRIPRSALVRRWALVIGCLLALVAAVVLPFGARAHRAEARALDQCQQAAKAYTDLVAKLARSAGVGQIGLAAGTGDPGEVRAYRVLYTAAKDTDRDDCAAKEFAAARNARASGLVAARSALQTKMDAVAQGGCSAGISGSASSCVSQDEAGQDKVLDWISPSGGTQPELSSYQDLSVRVSLDDQRVYVMSGSTVIYTMICSSGTGDTTPTGSFQVQNRGTTFFNGSEGLGANYWVSWKNWGEYLFHSVPIDENGDYVASEALKLGHKASTGCIRLTVDDAKWFYDELPENTTVTIG